MNLFSKNASRKFVDVIFRASGLFVNIDAQESLALGDYGYLNRETGKFLKQGNIFEENKDVEMESKERALENVAILSEGTTQVEVDDTDDTPGFEHCSFKTRLTFAKGSGAAILMQDVVSSELGNQGVLTKLFDSGALPKDKIVVTDVYACTSYALLFDGKKGGNALLGFRNAPLEADDDESAVTQSGWVSSNTSGVVQHAFNTEGHRIYYPLCRLRGIPRRPLWPMFR